MRRGFEGAGIDMGPGESIFGRRRFLQLLSAPALAFLIPGCGLKSPRSGSPAMRHPRPSDPDWPSPAAWNELNERVKGRLLQPTSHVRECMVGPDSPACALALRNAENPFYLEDQAGATQSTGWSGAWESAPSAYGVAAETAEDIATAVDFARRHRLRLVIKGTGHDYLGRSCAPDSLLIWTHRMRKTFLHDDFVPAGALPSARGMPAISVQAGARWIEAYNEVTTRNGRYVQGGGCASVGAAGGFVQGGGFGSFSKKFGTGAAGLLEAEVVVADGRILTVNAYQNPDLFWALRGGGGGTFGVVTRMTLRTHPLPEQAGIVRGKILAASDEAYRALIERFVQFYDEQLNNEHWGEQFAFQPDNSVTLFLTFQGLSEREVAARFDPLKDELARSPAYTVEIERIALTGRELWNLVYWEAHHPDLVRRDPRAGQPDGQYWWAPNSEEVSKYWYTYQSRWIPAGLFRAEARKRFADLIFEASRHWTLSMHINKGLAGASEDAIQRSRETSTNPVVYDAAALVILGAGERGSFPQVEDRRPDPAVARNQVAKVNAAMKIIRDATPDSGAYANEADYFETDWQHQLWGVNYPRLLEIKRKYDPDHLFHHHHCVGSEGWSRDGMSWTSG